MLNKLKESLEEFEREDWPLVNCKDQAQIAKFNKYTMEIPEILAQYYQRQREDFDS